MVMHDGVEVGAEDVLSEVLAAYKRADDLGVMLVSVQFYPDGDGYRVSQRNSEPAFERIRKIKELLDGAKNSIC